MKAEKGIIWKHGEMWSNWRNLETGLAAEFWVD